MSVEAEGTMTEKRRRRAHQDLLHHLHQVHPVEVEARVRHDVKTSKSLKYFIADFFVA